MFVYTCLCVYKCMALYTYMYVFMYLLADMSVNDINRRFF